MWIRYFVTEDGDDMNHPNVFRINTNTLTVADIKKAFPLSGHFEFRVLKQFGTRNVWLDLVNPSDPVPVQNNSVFLKVSRILDSRSSGTLNNNHAHSSRSDRTEPTTSVQSQAPVSVSAKPATSPRVTPNAAPAPVAAPQLEELLNFDDIGASPNKPINAAGVSSSSSTTSTSKSAFDDDLLGIHSAAAQPTAAASAARPAPVNDVFSADPFGTYSNPMIPTTSAPSRAPVKPPVAMSPSGTNPRVGVDPFATMSSNPMMGGSSSGGMSPMMGSNPMTMNMGSGNRSAAPMDPFSGLNSLGGGNNSSSRTGNQPRRY